jgi:hypothetical protein
MASIVLKLFKSRPMADNFLYVAITSALKQLTGFQSDLATVCTVVTFDVLHGPGVNL